MRKAYQLRHSGSEHGGRERSHEGIEGQDGQDAILAGITPVARILGIVGMIEVDFDGL